MVMQMRGAPVSRAGRDIGVPRLAEGDPGRLLTLLGCRLGFLALGPFPAGIDALVNEGPQPAGLLAGAVDIPGLGIADPHLEGLAVDARLEDERLASTRASAKSQTRARRVPEERLQLARRTLEGVDPAQGEAHDVSVRILRWLRHGSSSEHLGLSERSVRPIESG
nr:hypothetical protein [Thioalkalivibrio paradoxus]